MLMCSSSLRETSRGSDHKERYPWRVHSTVVHCSRKRRRPSTSTKDRFPLYVSCLPVEAVCPSPFAHSFGPHGTATDLAPLKILPGTREEKAVDAMNAPGWGTVRSRRRHSSRAPIGKGQDNWAHWPGRRSSAEAGGARTCLNSTENKQRFTTTCGTTEQQRELCLH